MEKPILDADLIMIVLEGLLTTPVTSVRSNLGPHQSTWSLVI